MIPKAAFVVLVGLALLLPIAATVLFLTSQLLAAMDDPSGAHVIQRMVLASSVVWATDLAALVCCLGLQTLTANRHNDDE